MIRKKEELIFIHNKSQNSNWPQKILLAEIRFLRRCASSHQLNYEPYALPQEQGSQDLEEQILKVKKERWKDIPKRAEIKNPEPFWDEISFGL